MLTFEDLSIHFKTDTGTICAVHSLNLHIAKAKITCLVGESGCGKSLTAKAILGLLPKVAFTQGKIWFNQRREETRQDASQAIKQAIDLCSLSEKALCNLRGTAISMIFQEPMTALNPVLQIGFQVAEMLLIHQKLSKADAKTKAIELLAATGIHNADQRYNDYPHQLSGGMRQRVTIAMALACSPALLLADEPTTALDSSIQGQILAILKNESLKRGMSVLLISHDLSVVASMADDIGIMYAGYLVEFGKRDAILKNALHPYTKGLLNCAPSIENLNLKRLPTISGNVPSLGSQIQGCAFAKRCQEVIPKCLDAVPLLQSIDNAHSLACWKYQ